MNNEKIESLLNSMQGVIEDYKRKLKSELDGVQLKVALDNLGIYAPFISEYEPKRIYIYYEMDGKCWIDYDESTGLFQMVDDYTDSAKGNAKEMLNEYKYNIEQIYQELIDWQNY